MKNKTITVAYALLTFGFLLILLSESQLVDVKFVNLFRTIGTTIIPASLVAILFQYLIRKGFQNEVRNQLSDVIRTEFESVNRLNSSGIVDSFPAMPTSKTAQLIKVAEREVIIFQTWIPDLIVLEKNFISCIKNGGEIKILIMDPESEHARTRSRTLGFPDDKESINSIRSNLEELKRFCKENSINSKLQVKVYNEPGITPMYFIDNNLILGWFWRGKQCVQGTHLFVERGNSGLFDEMKTSFEKVWKSESTRDIVVNYDRSASQTVSD